MMLNGILVLVLYLLCAGINYRIANLEVVKFILLVGGFFIVNNVVKFSNKPELSSVFNYE